MQVPDQNTIFITGACGFVGQYFVELLVRTTNFKLILNCRKADKRSDSISGIKFTGIDLNDQEALEAIFKTYHPGIIIHLAGITRIKDGENEPNSAYQTNYTGSISLIKLAKQFAVKKFVFVSSDLARDHQSVIGITKFLTESFIQHQNSSATQIVTIRLPNISATPGSVPLFFDNKIINKLPITITHPEMSRRFLSGKEAAECIFFVMKNGMNKDLFVVNKPPVKIADLAQGMINESGEDVSIKYIGIRPGEKLVEKGYAIDEIKHTSFGDLSLLKRKPFGSAETTDAIQMLKNKPGFTLNTDQLYK